MSMKPTIHVLTLNMIKQCDVEGEHWVGTCVELDLVTAGPDHYQVWQDLFVVCQAHMAFAVERGLESELMRG